MTEFRFFGRFNPELNKPDSSDSSHEISESEAKTRYFDRSARLDIVPPIEASTGKVPYLIRVVTGQEPGFVVFTYDELGLPLLEQKWISKAEGRLFLLQMIVRRYDLRQWTSARRRDSRGWDSQVLFDIDEDGHAYLQAMERENGRALPGGMSAETEMDPAFLFRDRPEWGRWDELLESPVDLAEFGLKSGA